MPGKSGKPKDAGLACHLNPRVHGLSPAGPDAPFLYMFPKATEARIPDTSMNTPDRKEIRKKIKALRESLAADERLNAGKLAAAFALTLPELQNADTIALYMTDRGELPTEFLLEELLSRGKRIALPRVDPVINGKMTFRVYRDGDVLVPDRFGIREPGPLAPEVPLGEIDLMFTPLVAFDHSGMRLGMGGGFYDRTLAERKRTGSGPFPVGLALSCQEIPSVPAEEWDMPLPAIVTELGIIRI